MSTARGLSNFASTSLNLSRPTLLARQTRLAVSTTPVMQHAAASTYFANPTTHAYYATAHKATWHKSGSRSSLEK